MLKFQFEYLIGFLVSNDFMDQVILLVFLWWPLNKVSHNNKQNFSLQK